MQTQRIRGALALAIAVLAIAHWTVVMRQCVASIEKGLPAMVQDLGVGIKHDIIGPYIYIYIYIYIYGLYIYRAGPM